MTQVSNPVPCSTRYIPVYEGVGPNPYPPVADPAQMVPGVAYTASTICGGSSSAYIPAVAAVGGSVIPPACPPPVIDNAYVFNVQTDPVSGHSFGLYQNNGCSALVERMSSTAPWRSVTAVPSGGVPGYLSNLVYLNGAFLAVFNSGSQAFFSRDFGQTWHRFLVSIASTWGANGAESFYDGALTAPNNGGLLTFRSNGLNAAIFKSVDGEIWDLVLDTGVPITEIRVASAGATKKSAYVQITTSSSLTFWASYDGGASWEVWYNSEKPETGSLVLLPSGPTAFDSTEYALLRPADRTGVELWEYVAGSSSGDITYRFEATPMYPIVGGVTYGVFFNVDSVAIITLVFTPGATPIPLIINGVSVNPTSFIINGVPTSSLPVQYQPPADWVRPVQYQPPADWVLSSPPYTYNVTAYMSSNDPHYNMPAFGVIMPEGGDLTPTASPIPFLS